MLLWRPEADVRLALSVDPKSALLIDRTWDVPVSHIGGRNITDQHAMREGVIMTVGEHIDRIGGDYREREILALVGNGNLKANPGFVAYSDGDLHKLDSEPAFQRPYTCLVAWRTGYTTVEDVWFGEEDGRRIVLQKLASKMRDITAEITFATSAQPILRHGDCVPCAHIAEQWYDTRHLIQPICVRLNGITIFLPNSQLQKGLARKALCEPVQFRAEARIDEQISLPLTVDGWLCLRAQPHELAAAASYLRARGLAAEEDNFSDVAVLVRVAERIELLFAEALDEARYACVDDGRVLSEGEFRRVNGCHVEIFFKKAIYPHNFFVRLDDGSCGFVVFPGESGRSGTTIAAAQQLLKHDLKVRDALLLDNGGDVRLWYRGQYLVQPSQRREELRSVVAVLGPSGGPIADTVRVF